MNNEIKLSREEERAIDKRLGPDFKKQMNEFAEKLGNLMLEFPLAQGHSREAEYLQQPFSMMSGALHLVKRFGMTEEERNKDDAIIAAIPAVLDRLADMFEVMKERPMEANNMKAMREAMAKIAKCMDEILVRTELDSIIHRKALEAQNLADGVLMEPPRNCDVGTAEEQCKRFQDFCDDSQVDEDYTSMCARCTLRREKHCELAWAQMPCAESEAR